MSENATSIPNVDDVEPLEIPEDGTHELEVLHASAFTSQKGRPCLRLRLQIPGDEDKDDVQGMVFYPSPENDDQKAYKQMAQKARRFHQSFGIPGGTDAEDMIGARGYAKVRRVDGDQGEYAEVSRFE